MKLSSGFFGRSGRAFCFRLVLVLCRAHAVDLYVSTEGSDSNAGTPAQPFRTLTHAYRLAHPGVRIIVMPGVYVDYTSGWGLHLNANGTPCSPIVVKSQVKGGAVLDGQNAADRNLGIYLDGSYNIVDGFEIRNNPNGGVSIWGDHNQILNSEIHHNGNAASPSVDGKDGIYSSPYTSGNVYAANYVHDNGRQGSNLDHGLYMCGKDELVINNVLAGNASAGLQVAGYTTVSNLRVYNNVMAWNGADGIVLWQVLSGVDIKNNILCQNGEYGLGSSDAHGAGVVVDHNLSFGNMYGDYDFTGGGSDYAYVQGVTITTSPLVVDLNLAGFDAHLLAGSSAIGAGLNLSSVFTDDKDGASRPASGPWDIGAYRYLPNEGVTLISPANGSTVSGSLVSVSAIVSDLLGIAVVQFQLDGNDMGPPVLLPPYQAAWDTITVSDGPHSLSAVATGLLGTQDIAAPVLVTVSNRLPELDALTQTFGSTSGTLGGPFYVTNNAIVQATFATLDSSGRAAYCFAVPSTADYLVSALVNAPATNANSFFVNIDAEPSDPVMIWDIPVTAGTANRIVSWRGNGTPGADQFVPKVFNLAAGSHQLIVRGRSAGCQLGDITIQLATTLRVAQSDGMIELSWPSALSGYLLESKSLFASTDNWTAVTNLPAIVGNTYRVTRPASLDGKIYRLRGQAAQ